MKACTTCRVPKPESEFFFDKRRGKLYSRCKSCHNSNARGLNADYRQRHPERNAIACTKYQRKAIAEVNDWYAKHTLFSGMSLRVPDSAAPLVKAKREHIRLTRLLQGREQ